MELISRDIKLAPGPWKCYLQKIFSDYDENWYKTSSGNSEFFGFLADFLKFGEKKFGKFAKKSKNFPTWELWEVIWKYLKKLSVNFHRNRSISYNITRHITFNGLTFKELKFTSYPLVSGIRVISHTEIQHGLKSFFWDWNFGFPKNQSTERSLKPVTMTRLAASVRSIFWSFILIPRSTSGIPFNIWADSRPSSRWIFDFALYFWKMGKITSRMTTYLTSGNSYRFFGSKMSDNFATLNVFVSAVFSIPRRLNNSSSIYLFISWIMT